MARHRQDGAQRGSFKKVKSHKGKRPYATRAEAQAVVAQRIAAGAYGPRLNVYPCRRPDCKAFHIGHLILRKV
jgi:hypothetical protein